MPDDAKSIIHETIHEVCEQIIMNPVAHPPLPHIVLPVPVTVHVAPYILFYCLTLYYTTTTAMPLLGDVALYYI
jgi:hypothetical protein